MESQILPDINSGQQQQQPQGLYEMPSVEMVEVVGATIDRMHSEFAHSVPRGVAIESMLTDWSAALNRNGVPAESVPQCYDAACTTRIKRGISSFMPTVHDLVAEWFKVSGEGQREKRIVQEAAQRHQQVEQAELLSVPPSPAFDQTLEKAKARRGRRAA